VGARLGVVRGQGYCGAVPGISPATRILVWGDSPLFIPQYFAREPFDGAVLGGDAELVLPTPSRASRAANGQSTASS